MPQNYRIYINDNTLTIGKKKPSGDGTLQQLDIQNFDFPTFYKSQRKQQFIHYFLPSEDAETVFSKIKRQLKVVKAAGGLVFNARQEVLFIYRNDKWDLPKGKVEKNEKSRAAGVREVGEECGVLISGSGKKICKTYHVYIWADELVLKRTNWYEMKVSGSPRLKPQKEEGITKAVWVPAGKVRKKLENTYPLISEVLENGKVL